MDFIERRMGQIVLYAWHTRAYTYCVLVLKYIPGIRYGRATTPQVILH